MTSGEVTSGKAPSAVTALDDDPARDLRLERVIRAPRERVWRAWSDPDQLAQWWLPAPARCRVDRLELIPGGAFVTAAGREGADFTPQFDGCFLLVDAQRRLVFTNALDGRWRPARPYPVALTAEITLTDHPEGTLYRAVVRHGDAEARDEHERMGFAVGWGTVTAQLAALAEARHS